MPKRVSGIIYSEGYSVTSYLARLSFVATALVALAACSAPGSVSFQPGSSQPGSSGAATKGVANPTLLERSLQVLEPIEAQAMPMKASQNPCNIKGEWYFRGSCSQVRVKAGDSSTILLAPYKGIALSEGLGPNQDPGTTSTTIVSGEGTSTTDITGEFSGAAFPLYGTTCFHVSIKSRIKSTPCTGKALIYFDLAYTGKSQVDFPATPSVQVKAAAATGMCQYDMLVKVKSTFGYELLPSTGKVSKGALTLKAIGGNYVMDPHSFFVFAVSCK